MSLLADIKADLRITGSAHDALLQSIIDEVMSECMAAFDYPEGFDIENALHARRGVRLLVAQDFEGAPEKRGVIVEQARALWRLDALMGAE